MTTESKRVIASIGLVTAALFLVAGCSSGTSTGSTVTSANTGAAFVVGTDAPMASVTSFVAQLQSVTATDAKGNTVSLVSGSPTIDFARYNGLQTLLDLNNVPEGTYTGVQITLGPTATIGYLNVTGTSAPTIQTMNATLTSQTATVTLANPLVVASGAAPVGLRVDFQIAKSIQVDSSDNITGTVTPTFKIDSVGVDDAKAYVDEYNAAVLSVNAAGQSFVVQGPHGTQLTVSVNGQTEWDGDASLSNLSSSTIVQLSGKLDKVTGTLDADEVEILSQQGFYASGQVTYVTPASGTATSFDMYVRGLLPSTTGLTLGQIATVDLTGSEKFSIYWMHDALAQFLFNADGLLPGQDVAVGGPASGATNPQSVSVHRVVLRDWGFNGTVVAGSENMSSHTFQMQVNGFAGVLIPQTVTVYIGGDAQYRDGFTQESDITDNAKVRVVGVLLKDPMNGNPVIVGHYVDSQN
jgi:hypothetical protein